MPDRPVALQSSLLDLLDEAPWFAGDFSGVERLDLGQGAWIDHGPDWLRASDAVFTQLLEALPWQGRMVDMYERKMAQPRLTAAVDLTDPRVPLLADMATALSARYGVDLRHCFVNLYRDGRDSVAWHGDRIARDRMGTAVVAIVSLGERRPFLLRPAGGGRSLRYELGRGDLFVMGGTCQRTWQHSIPKVARAGPRISITLRHWVPG